MNIGYINTKAAWSSEEQKESIQRKAIELNITIDRWYFEDSSSYYYVSSPTTKSKRVDLTLNLNSGDVIITHSLFIISCSSNTILRKINQILKNKATIISALENVKIDNSITPTHLLDIIYDLSYYKYDKDKQKIYMHTVGNKSKFCQQRREELKNKIPIMKKKYKGGCTLSYLMNAFKISYQTLVHKIIPLDSEFMELFKARRHRSPQSKLPERPLTSNRWAAFNRNLLIKQLNNKKLISEEK